MNLIELKMKKILLYLTIIIATCSACSDFLEQEPGTQTSVDEVFSSYEGYQSALNGCYYMLNSQLTSDENAVYADVLGGNLTFTPSTSNHNFKIPESITNIYSFADNADDSEMESVYDNLYDIINSANIIIERLPDLNDATTDQVSQMNAEALCIRAISHFYLLRLFAQNHSYTSDASHPGIIYNTRVQIAGEDYPARKTVQESYELIIKDLQDALSYFKSETILEGSEYSYFTSTVCDALLARVALYAEDYDLAISSASNVILNSGISLMTKEEYVTEWEKPDTPVSEIIFELSARINDDGEYISSIILSGFFGYTSDTDYSDYCVSSDLLNMFENDDVRYSNMFIKADLETAIENSTATEDLTYYFTNKFQDNPGNPILRISEMYLIRAEAYARLDEPENALTDLNTLREERGATLALVTDDLLEEIFLERRKELCFEGHLFFDIARFHKNAERNSGCIATTCNLNYPSNYFILPIPKENTELNSNLEQNEGYY